jgi:regulator of protease activity HflC (stomatin/prohibitin superfamily)
VVDQIELQAIPPRQLTAAFAAVLEAEVRRSKLLNDARSYENQVLSRSRSDAATRTNTALAARTALVESMGVEAKRVGKLVPEYRKDPQLFTRLRLTDVLGRIYTNAQDKIVLQERGDGRPRELRLQLNREPPKLKAPEPPKDDHGH